MNIIAANKRANYDYTFSDKMEAGIVLTGPEVKSLRVNTSSLRGSYIIERDGELWLLNCYIKQYVNSKIKNYEPNRDKKLLLNKKEINKVIGLIKQSQLSSIPITLYFNNKGVAKLLFGLGKGKKKYDKRQSIKQKDWNIKKERLLKSN